MDMNIVRKCLENDKEHFKFRVSDGYSVLDDCLYLGEYGKFSLVFVLGHGIVVCNGLNKFGLLEEVEGFFKKGVLGKFKNEEKDVYKLAKEAFKKCKRVGSFYQF